MMMMIMIIITITINTKVSFNVLPTTDTHRSAVF